MNPKQVEELKFWSELIKTEGPLRFIERRRADFYRHMNNFQGKADLLGRGIEIGTGCFSQLEWSNADNIIGVDPLNEEFKLITPERNEKVSMRTLDGEALPDTFESLFDWVVCWNVIDHTPNPEKMAAEFFRVLKSGGKLYFEVNFDDKLAAPHYDLWNDDVVKKYLPEESQIYRNYVRNEADHQTLMYAVYQKP